MGRDQGLPAPWPLRLFGARSWLAGYLAGVLVAEWSWARPQAGPVRAAALVPHRLANYLPARVVVGLRLAALAVRARVGHPHPPARAAAGQPARA